MSTVLKKRLHQEVDALPDDLQRKVLDFARALALSVPQGVPGKQLLKFSGLISAEDARQMLEAVEAGCEKVDDEW